MVMAFGSIAKRPFPTIVVATDGTGDYTDIQTAINAAGAVGATIWIKAGAHSTTSLTLANNITLKGDGWGTVITLSAIYPLLIQNKSNVRLENLKCIFTTAGASEAPVDVEGSTNVVFENVYFQKSGASTAGAPRGFVWTSGATTVTGMNIRKCKFENVAGGNVTAIITCIMDNCVLVNNDFGTIDMLDKTVGATVSDSIIYGNYTGDILTDGIWNSIVAENQVTGNIELATPDSTHSDDNVISSNFVSGSISLAADCDENKVIGNKVATQITDNGANNQISLIPKNYELKSAASQGLGAAYADLTGMSQVVNMPVAGHALVLFTANWVLTSETALPISAGFQLLKDATQIAYKKEHIEIIDGDLAACGIGDNANYYEVTMMAFISLAAGNTTIKAQGKYLNAGCGTENRHMVILLFW